MTNKHRDYQHLHSPEGTQTNQQATLAPGSVNGVLAALTPYQKAIANAIYEAKKDDNQS
jgi:hypothetical protein